MVATWMDPADFQGPGVQSPQAKVFGFLGAAG